MTTNTTLPAAPGLDARVEALERRLREVETRLAPRPAPPVAPPAAAVAPAPARPPARHARGPPRPAPYPRATPRPRPAFDLERFLGGHVLAWVGGVAVLAGLALLFALGISRGWIGPVGRTATGAAFSAALVLVGIRLHERRGRTEAARAAVACGAAGLFLTITVAARVYEIVPPAAGLALAAAVAAGTALLAVRWTAPVIGALGLAGALLAPVLAGAALDLPTLAFLLVAAVGSSAVLVRQRWIWLSVAVFGIPAAQLVAWLGEQPAALAAALALAAFGTVNVVAALGVDIRARETPLRFAGAYLLGANALLLAAGGWVAIDGAAGRLAGVEAALIIGSSRPRSLPPIVTSAAMMICSRVATAWAL